MCPIGFVAEGILANTMIIKQGIVVNKLEQSALLGLSKSREPTDKSTFFQFINHLCKGTTIRQLRLTEQLFTCQPGLSPCKRMNHLNIILWMLKEDVIKRLKFIF